MNINTVILVYLLRIYCVDGSYNNTIYKKAPINAHPFLAGKCEETIRRPRGKRKIIIKLSLKKQGVRTWTGFF
jgi:hypothetical protein